MESTVVKSKHVITDAKAFALIEQFVLPYERGGRTDSAALLIWFLKSIFRLEMDEAIDAICDRSHDEGFDAIFVDHEAREIFVFQAKRAQKARSALGDVELKSFVGSLLHLGSADLVEGLRVSTQNQELRDLIARVKLVEAVRSDYKLRPIFVCNLSGNVDATKYLEQARAAGSPIDLWDAARLGVVADQLNREWFVDEEVRLNFKSDRFFYLGLGKSNPDLIYAAIPARELVRLPGISDTRIFAQNVRLFLGDKTTVNRQMIQTIREKKEHANFLQFHNGLTIVARSMRIRGKRIWLDGFSVCNGCQSLSALHKNQQFLTDELEVLVRFVRVGTDRTLQETISERTNSQNAITLRDLSSNDDKQIALQAEFNKHFGKRFFYSLRRGESAGTAAPLFNEDAGKLLLAVYCREPDETFRRGAILDTLREKIFSFDTDAFRVRLCQMIFQAAADALTKARCKPIQDYAGAVYFVSFAISEMLRSDPQGHLLLEAPRRHLSTDELPNQVENSVFVELKRLGDCAVSSLDYFIEEAQKGEGFDFRAAFKSSDRVATMANHIKTDYEKDVKRGKESPLRISV